MTNKFKYFAKGIELRGEASDPSDNAAGSVWHNSTSFRLKAYIESAVREIVTNSQTQALTNKTIDADQNTITNIENADIKAGAAIDASKIANGSVSNAEFQYLDGVTSAIQTQIDGKEPSFTTLPISKGGTNSGTALSNNRVIRSSGGAIVEAAAITASRALVSDANGIPTHSATTSTELGYVSGLTSAVQTQLDSKVNASGGTLTNGSIVTPTRLDVKKDTKANLLTYAATAANGQLVFSTDTKEMFQILDGALVSVGSGGTSNVDALLTQTFDESALTDFTQTGLALIETNPMNGKKTARLIHQAATTQSFKYVKAVDPKYRGKNLTMSFQVRSSATAGNVTLNIYDETNAANIVLSQSITLGSSTISATTNSNTTLSGISSSDINKLKVGETITGSGIPTGTTITAISISALTATISQAATASATVTLKNSDLPQKQSASFDVPNNCASLSYTISALAESGLPETYVDDVVIGLTSAALTSTSVSIPTKDGQVVGSKKVELQGDTTFSGTIPADNTIPQITEGSQVLTLSYAMKRAGNKLRIRSSAYVTEDTNTGDYIVMALFKDSDANAIASNAVSTLDANAYQSGTIVIEKDITVSSASTVTISLRGGNNTGSFHVNKLKNGSAPDYGGTMITSLTVEEIQVGDYSEATTIPLTSAVFQTQPDSEQTWFTMTGYASTRTRVPYFSVPRNMTGSAFSWTSSAINGLEITIQEDGYYNARFEINCQGGGDVSHYAIGLNTSDFTTAFTSLRSDFLDYKYRNGANQSDTVHLAYSGPLKAGDKIYPLGNSSTSYIRLETTNFGISKAGAVKQVNISSDQKVDLPSAELIMDYANGTGSTNNAVFKFNGIQKVVGDAFTVVNDSALGFSLTMKKSGILHIVASPNVGATNAYFSLSKNATQFTTNPQTMTAGQNIAGNYAGGNENNTLVWQGKVVVGDTFRVHSSSTTVSSAAANFGQGFQAFFIEDKVQVSLSNVLPQFTQSDSSVRVDTVSGASNGTTNTTVMKFTSVRDNFGTDITYTGSSTLGDTFTINSDGIYSVNCGTDNALVSFCAITKNSSQLSSDPYAINQQDVLSRSGGNANGSKAVASWTGYLVKGDVIRGQSSRSDCISQFMTVSKVGKPNLTSVDVTPFTNYKAQDVEVIKLSGGNGSGSTNTKIRRFSVIDNYTNLGVIRYTDDAILGGYFTVLKNCVAEISYTDVANGTSAGWIGVVLNSSQNTTAITALTDGTVLTSIVLDSTAATDYVGTCSAVVKLNVGDIIRCHQGVNVCKTNGIYGSSTIKANLQIKAVAEADQIVSPISSFSSDTASLVYAPSTSYTLSTLTNAPVGTFITFTAAAGANTQTQTTTAPTQSVSDMNVNGIQITGRGFNQTSTAAAPSIVAIQIGKGFKGVQVNGYRTTSKTGVVSLDNQIVNVNINTGLSLKDYNENTGVLILDAALDRAGSTNNRYFINDDSTNLTLSSCYIVINASKSPTLAAVPQLQNRVAYLSEVQASNTNGGASVATTWTTRTLNTLVDSTGIVTSLASNQFTLPAGTYNVKAFSPQNSTNGHKCRIRNITDGTTLVVGETAYNSTAVSLNCPAILEGEFTLTSSKALALQYYSVISQGTNGLGISVNSGEVEVYGRVVLTKIK